MNPRVSVILTSYNKSKYLRQAIASVLAQTFEDWELWIVDDYSEDGSYSIGVKYHEIDSRIAIIESLLMPHGCGDDGLNRYAANINQAFKLCSGEYITYLCDDDLYLPWRLEMMIRCMDFEKKAYVMYGKQQTLDEDEQGNLFMGKVRNTVGVTSSPSQQVDHSSIIHRRECFEKVGGWDESAPTRYGDAGFFTRLNKAGYSFYPIQLVMDCHRYNPSSVTWKIDHSSPPAFQFISSACGKPIEIEGVNVITR